MKRKNFVIACKTYRGDISAFDRMIKSFHKHNKDNILLVVSIPKSDRNFFSKYEDERVKIISDEDYAGKYFSDERYWGLELGYLNQEICKLSFWETGISENYLFVDSDVYFIRDFYVYDFMADERTPYSVLIQDKDLYVQPFYREYSKERIERIKIIFDEVGLDDRRLLTCHGMTVLNRDVLQNMKQTFMKQKKLSYSDLLRISPFEYSWYNAWLQKSNIIKILQVEPFFKTFHMREEYQAWRTSLITEDAIAEQYVGLILNSNWHPVGPPSRYQEPGRINKILHKLMSVWG